jgi:glycosyltransferase involved in cell wall biosynthesis
MIIHVYTMCYNEEVLMPYFLRHYEQFTDKIFVFDNHSTDDTPNIVDSSPKTIRIICGDPEKFYDSHLIRMKNEEYKKSRGIADWVIIVDTDEFIYHPELVSLLEKYKKSGITFPKTCGYDMIGDNYPKGYVQVYDEIKYGVSEPFYSKRSVFDPSIDINYAVGAHRCSPTGNVVESPNEDIKLLHYRFLCKEHFVKIMERRQNRCSDENIARGWSYMKLPPEETVKGWLENFYETRKKNRVKVIG